MTIDLRDYQDGALNAVRDRYRAGVHRPLVCLPTGTGKTVIFAHMASSAVKKGRSVLVLAHRDELIQQAVDKLCLVDPDLCIQIGVVKAERDEYSFPVTVASVQTLSREQRLRRVCERGWPFDIIIVDEAHHAAADSYQRIIRELGGFEEHRPPLVVGVTATPQRADSKDLGATWQEIVYHRDILSMIAAGYLCDMRGVQVGLEGFDAGALKVRRGDFIDSELEQALLDADAPEHAVAAYMEHALGRKAILFTPTVKVAQAMAAAFVGSGIDAAIVHANTPLEERRAMLRSFTAGDIKVMCNCGVLTEGYDEPSVDCIIVARPTRSQPLYVQMVGRGTRIYPGKKDCLVIDLVGATSRHDLNTLPKMMGLNVDDLSEAAQQVLEEEGVAAAMMMHQEEQERQGVMVARRVELFRRNDLAWNQAMDGCWALMVGDEAIMLEADGELWKVTVYPRRGASTTLADGLDQGYAMGVAEQYARGSSAFAPVLSDRAAAWRTKLASPRQLEMLTKLKVQAWNGMTAGEASDAISSVLARRQRNRAQKGGR